MQPCGPLKSCRAAALLGARSCNARRCRPVASYHALFAQPVRSLWGQPSSSAHNILVSATELLPVAPKKQRACWWVYSVAYLPNRCSQPNPKYSCVGEAMTP
jgi:hypothetical protein